MANAPIALQPIGILHTAHSGRNRAPRQSDPSEIECQTTLVLNPGQNFEQALEDLAGFDMIWIIAWLDRNSTWNPKIRPPRGPLKKRGLFATRSPHRPNPLGLSAVRLLEIKGRTLYLGATDLMDGTPVLDIKPYIPYADAFPDSRAGWIDELNAAEAQQKDNRQFFSVIWSELAAQQAHWLDQTHRVSLQEEATRILAADPTPHPHRCISRWSRTHSILAIRSWRLKFSIKQSSVCIERIVSGDPIAETASRATSTQRIDQKIHESFNARWPQLRSVNVAHPPDSPLSEP